MCGTRPTISLVGVPVETMLAAGRAAMEEHEPARAAALRLDPPRDSDVAPTLWISLLQRGGR